MTALLREARAWIAAQNIALSLCRALILVSLASVVAAALAHEFRVLATSRSGEPYPMVLYDYMPSPGTSPVKGAPGAAGGDFSQVYTSALALRHGESAYFPARPEFADRFGRPAGYPPLTNWLYTPAAALPYYEALVLHTVLWLVAFMVTSGGVLWAAGLSRYAPWLWLAQLALYFLTPIGFTHFERGQFDFIVAIACALCMACTFVQTRFFVLAAIVGFLGTLKWTSAAFLGCFCVFSFFLSTSPRRWAFFLIPVLMVLGTLAFWSEVREYWHSIEVFELNAKPRGNTFQHLLPRSWTKALPVLGTVIVGGLTLLLARSREDRTRLLSATSVPFALMLMNLAICFGTVSYEYHTVSTLGLLPGLVIWSEREPLVPRWLKASSCALVVVFLAVAFRTFQFRGPFDGVAMTKAYAVFTLLFFGVSVAAAVLSARALRLSATA